MLSERLRNQVIEYAGVASGAGGVTLAFLGQGTTDLAPTAPNIALILALYALFSIGGIALLTALWGDQGAKSFLAYFENERGVAASRAKATAKIVVALSLIALLTVVVTK